MEKSEHNEVRYWDSCHLAKVLSAFTMEHMLLVTCTPRTTRIAIVGHFAA